MGLLVKLLKWLWRAFEIFAPIASVLWGVGVYSGLAMALYVIVSQTANLVGEANIYFVNWADGLSSNITEIFSAVTDNSFFNFLAYILSLDVPFEWFRYCADTFLRFWLKYALGAFLAVLETCIVVIGIMFVRNRLKTKSLGVDAP